jgi:CheY-like chemotaxis protein
MQAFDAMELLRRLRGKSSLDRAASSRTDAPAVLIENAPGETDTRAAEELGIARVLAAPLELDEVVRSLHEVFEAWRADHPDSPLADSASARAF